MPQCLSTNGRPRELPPPRSRGPRARSTVRYTSAHRRARARARRAPPVQLLCAEAGIPANAPVGVDLLERTGSRTRSRTFVSPLRTTPTRCPVPTSQLLRAPEPQPPTESCTDCRPSPLDTSRPAVARNQRGRRLDEFLDDIAAVAAAVRAGADTRTLLRQVRDESAGVALETLDRGGRGPEASHRDDLNALIAVAAGA